jgi:AraC-like DNA-binding protein
MRVRPRFFIDRLRVEGSAVFDILSAVLAELRMESAGYRRLELNAPWAVSFHQRGLRGIHIVVEGRCEMALDGGAARVLEAGDLVIAPRADAHVLRSSDARDRQPIDSFDLVKRSQGGVLRAGGRGERCTLVCGAFIFHQADHPALEALPPVIHVRGEGGVTPQWLAGYVDVLTAEAFDAGAGSAMVMARLSDALVARALRFHAEQTDHPGWLRGLADPPIAKALASIHSAPQHPWTVASLARSAALSRAAFAKRFTAAVGEPPLQYVLRCRMRRAMTLLCDGNATLAVVAESVGYGSEAAFSAAFKRHTGVAPGAYARGGSTRPSVRGPG